LCLPNSLPWCPRPSAGHIGVVTLNSHMPQAFFRPKCTYHIDCKNASGLLKAWPGCACNLECGNVPGLLQGTLPLTPAMSPLILGQAFWRPNLAITAQAFFMPYQDAAPGDVKACLVSHASAGQRHPPPNPCHAFAAQHSPNLAQLGMLAV
jgi:hypothetical protein